MRLKKKKQKKRKQKKMQGGDMCTHQISHVDFAAHQQSGINIDIHNNPCPPGTAPEMSSTDGSVSIGGGSITVHGNHTHVDCHPIPNESVPTFPHPSPQPMVSFDTPIIHGGGDGSFGGGSVTIPIHTDSGVTISPTVGGYYDGSGVHITEGSIGINVPVGM
jgi:hypothetical protein